MRQLVALLALAGCSPSRPSLTLTFDGDAAANLYRIELFEAARSMVVFDTGFVPVKGDLTRTKVAAKLNLSRAGRFKVLLLGVVGELDGDKLASGSTELFWAGDVTIGSGVELTARLLTVPAGDDADGDWWPDAVRFLADNSAAPARYQAHPELLDCVDDPAAMPVDGGGKPVPYRAAEINPFTVEKCGNGFDENCSGPGDDLCVDADGDGDPSLTDCDDKDPARHHATATDPYPDPPNCCGYSLGKKGTPEESTNFTGDATLCPAARCGDGIDQSCSGNDTACVTDADCDGHPPPPVGNDCDDNDPKAHPNAPEPCGSDKDLDCDGKVNGGCVPCDLDGDTYQRNDAANGCPDDKDQHPGQLDCNDYDAAVFPGATTACGGTEAGSGAIGRLSCSLRQTCRRYYEPLGIGLTARVSSLGWLLGDADCNGTAWEGCPPEACDADGDGWPLNDGVCAAVDGKFDCDDTTPTVYPGAPTSCGNGAAEDCTSQKQPCTQDGDQDGWNAGPDCDDGDPARHPFAPEKCNAKDDDCDGLTDEGNPDVNGGPLVQSGAVTACTDNNVGECGKQKGVCICSISTPASVVNTADRVICPTEDSGSVKPPRCFGAGQPHPQSCNAEDPRDDDCNGKNDDPDGLNLAEKGLPCGIDGVGPLSPCRQGVVVGCDSQQTSCFVQFGRVPASQAWYLCSAAAVCPVTEECNGLDDDCDGVLPGNPMSNPPLSMIPADDELDHDGDHYLACGGCSALGAGVLGCGDCDDTTMARFPGHTESCDNLDNACDGAWAISPGGSDGKDQCTGGTTCCSSQSTCRNFLTDSANCGGCGQACVVPKKATGCAGGACKCNQVAGCDPSATSGVRCDPTGGGGNGACVACNTNSFCGDGCDPCGAGQNCQADAARPGHYTCGCTSDSGCSGTQKYCNLVSGNCQATAPDGHVCGGATGVTCTNSCVDGYCCNTTCTAPCAACNVTGKLGICSAITGSTPVGSRSCTGNGVAPCGGYCNGATSCYYPSNITNCTPNLSCSGNTLQQQSKCSGSGTCTAGSSAACPGNVICATATTCKSTTCGTNADCVSGYYCNVGTCTLKKGLGFTCANAGECMSGNCLDGACCNVSACPTCRNCKQSTSASDRGTCVVVVANAEDGTSTNCDSGDFQMCNGAGACKYLNGVGCSQPSDCVSNFCVNGGAQNVCCNQACTGGCVEPTNCSAGTCDIKPAGTECGIGHYACDGVTTTCPVMCNNNNQCAMGYYCQGLACNPCNTGQPCSAGMACYLRCLNGCNGGSTCN